MKAKDYSDGKNKYEWESGYPPIARRIMFIESIYLFIMLFISLFGLFATWKGWVIPYFSLSYGQALTLKKYAYFAFSGMLGGITFGMKFFYRVAARGYWRQDRIFWRVMSPFIGMTIAIVMGAMINSCLVNAPKTINGSAILSIGFISGYFADEAIGKMYEVATVIFGKSELLTDTDKKNE